MYIKGSQVKVLFDEMKEYIYKFVNSAQPQLLTANNEILTDASGNFLQFSEGE